VVHIGVFKKIKTGHIISFRRNYSAMFYYSPRVNGFAIAATWCIYLNYRLAGTKSLFSAVEAKLQQTKTKVGARTQQKKSRLRVKVSQHAESLANKVLAHFTHRDCRFGFVGHPKAMTAKANRMSSSSREAL
jgi:hypothetical protein